MIAFGKSLRMNLIAHVVIVALYAALIAWWLTFFSGQTDRLIGQLAEDGVVLLGPQIDALRDANERTARMFLFEGGFLGLLMLGSMLLVQQAMRREQLAARDQANFLSAVTHELRSPIASARLYLESILMGRANEARTKRYLRNAHEDLNRLALMVDDVLEARRITQNGLEVEPVEADLRELLEPIVTRLAEVHARAGATVTLESGEPVGAQVDPAAFERIVDNLVSNGVKYGGENSRVELTVSLRGNQALLEVRDHGPGLSGADSQRIREAFVRGGDENVRTQPGTGLGLFLVQQMVTAHSGELHIRPADGGGTRVTVHLPALSHALEAVT